ncbi:hypothetical protein, partial [Pseudomonas sp. 2995-1]|uniref:hypothetical protein n=1 Tax=Pseudomonas sp. 2995-1 TaxID=1712679 RepID=UPI002115B20D
GYEAGEKAVEVLQDGKSAGDIPATFPANLVLEINRDAAEKMGVEITDDLESRATLVETVEEEDEE